MAPLTTHGPLSDRIRAAAIARAERRADVTTRPVSPWVARAIARTLPAKEYGR